MSKRAVILSATFLGELLEAFSGWFSVVDGYPVSQHQRSVGVDRHRPERCDAGIQIHR
jgi:hypothetical protein